MKVLDDITVEQLARYEGKDIAEICNTGYTAANVNHCAHFVGHVLGLKCGLVCGSMAYATRGQGASLRVNEIYNNCATRDLWSEKPVSVINCLAFVTRPSNMVGLRMGDNSKKHIGIFKDGTIWHYSNGEDAVVTHTPVAWHNRFRGVYGATTQMYYGVF